MVQIVNSCFSIQIITGTFELSHLNRLMGTVKLRFRAHLQWFYLFIPCSWMEDGHIFSKLVQTYQHNV